MAPKVLKLGFSYKRHSRGSLLFVTGHEFALLGLHAR